MLTYAADSAHTAVITSMSPTTAPTGRTAVVTFQLTASEDVADIEPTISFGNRVCSVQNYSLSPPSSADETAWNGSVSCVLVRSAPVLGVDFLQQPVMMFSGVGLADSG
jgi:hypothetical protein